MSSTAKQNDPTTTVPEVGGVVLCGGKSSRMGQPKHALHFGDRTLLETVIATVSQVVAPITVVRADGQQLPELQPGVIIAEDDEPDLGPLAGIAAGLAALNGKCRAAYVTSCDVPLLSPAVMRFLISSLSDHELAVPREGKFFHVLAGVYSVGLLDRVRNLLSARRLRPLFLVEESDAKIIEVDELRTFDPDLHSFRNVNTPEDYAAVLQIAGLPKPSC